MFMNRAEPNRPTTGASANELANELREIRARTRDLTQDLSSQQLMGPMLPIVNPVLWEIGHVGWFHEYWTLRHVHGAAPILERADALWNSSTVAHDARWELDLPNRDGVFGFLARVLERQLDRLGRGVDAPGRYFYELAIRHEDMHVEALAYTRQTLGYPAPARVGAVLGAAHRAGALSVRATEAVAVDTTVQEKAIAHPTEHGLLLAAIEQVGARAKKASRRTGTAAISPPTPKRPASRPISTLVPSNRAQTAGG